MMRLARGFYIGRVPYFFEAAGRALRREVDVLRFAARGLTTRAIADRLYTSPKTADHRIQHIYDKRGVSKRAAAL